MKPSQNPCPKQKWGAKFRAGMRAIKGVGTRIKGFWQLHQLRYNETEQQEHSCHDPAFSLYAQTR